LAFEHNDTIREIRGHDEIVFDNKRRLLCVENEAFDDFTRDDTLLRVQETVKL